MCLAFAAMAAVAGGFGGGGGGLGGGGGGLGGGGGGSSGGDDKDPYGGLSEAEWLKKKLEAKKVSMLEIQICTYMHSTTPLLRQFAGRDG